MRQLKITKSITSRDSQSLDKYLQEIGREQLLTVEELRKRILKTMANRPDLIYEARLRGLLSEEAEKMIEEITETLHLKNCKKKKKK